MEVGERDPTAQDSNEPHDKTASPSSLAKVEQVAHSPIWRNPAVVRLLAIALLAELGYATLNISTMPVYLRYDRGIPAGGIGLIVGAFLLSEALFKTPMGALADRVGHRKLIALGPALSIGTIFLTLIVPHNAGWFEGLALIGLRVIDGIGAAMLWPAAFALMGEVCPPKERHTGMSLINMCYFVGVALSLPLGGLANDYLGPYLANERTAALYLSAAFFAVAAVFAYRSLPRDDTKTSSPTTRFRLAILDQYAQAMRAIPNYLLLGAITFAGIGFPMVIIKLFAEEMFEMSETQFGLLVLPAAALMAALSVPLGRFGERIGRHRAVHVGLGMIALGISWIALGAFVPGLRAPVAMLLGSVPVGLGFLMTIPAWYASVSELNPDRRAANIGAVMMAQGFGAIVGALLGSQAYENLQIYGRAFGLYSPFIGCAICVIVGWLLSLSVLD